MQLKAVSSDEKKDFLPRYFKTGKGGYGEGDKFLGVTVPDIRAIAKANREVAYDAIDRLLDDEYHECRMCGLLILVEKFKKHKDDEVRREILTYYLSHTHAVNNWDLVDLSCRDIVGEYLKDKQDRNLLYRLSDSKVLWEQRIAMISTYAFIRCGDHDDALALAEKFLSHPHDLMHKAAGWMLREVGKRDKRRLTEFLDSHSGRMPRTMLRYSIEKFTPEERQYYMAAGRPVLQL